MIYIYRIFQLFFVVQLGFSVTTMAMIPVRLATSSKEYNQLWTKYRLSRNQQSENWYNQFNQFARQGELSAIETILTTFRVNDTHGKIEYLRSINPEQNIMAAFMLSRILLDSNSDECLKWFELIDQNYVAIQAMSQGNLKVKFDFLCDYAFALLMLKGDLPATRSALILLQRAEHLSGTPDEVKRLEAVYRALFNLAKMCNHSPVLLEYIRRTKTQPADITDAIKISSRRPFFEVLALNLPVGAERDNSLRELRDLSEMTSVFEHNLDQILFEELDRNLPILQMSDEDQSSATDADLRKWAQAIRTKYKDRLTYYEGENTVVKDLFTHLNDLFIEFYIVDELKSLLN